MEQSTEKSLFVPGAIIGGRYEVLDSLGSGGMGTVVRVKDRALNNETVALKLLYPHMAKDQTSFARFRNEVLIARKLAHPNIVRLYDFGAAGQGYYYISMEYVSGGNLSDRIYGEKDKRPNFQESLEILLEICEGLACAHQHGVIHRDLKPDNILITTNNVVKVSDFGLARSTGVDRGLTATGDTVGTPYYMAPEQLRGDKLDQRVDLYALGILAFEMVVGRRPFFHESYITLAHMHFKDPIPQIAGSESGIPEWFQEFVERCAAKKPTQRYASAREAADVIRTHLSDAGNEEIGRRPAVLSFYGSTKTKAAPSIKRKLGFWMLFAMGLLFVLLGTLLLVRSNEALRSKVVRLLLNTEQVVGVDATAVKEAINRNIARSDFLSAVVNGQEKVVSDLLASGTNPDSVDSQGSTALHLAAKTAQPQILKQALKAGALVDKTDALGRTALSYAVTVPGNEAVVEVLLANKADPGLGDKNLVTPLMYAVQSKDTGMANKLLRAGAKSDMRDIQGKTALMYAVVQQDPSMVSVILNDGTEINAQDNQGNTALHYSAQQFRNTKESKAILEALLAARASRSVKNKAGKSAIEVAPTRSRSELRKLLTLGNAKVSIGTRATSSTTVSNVVNQTRLRTRGELQTEAVRGGVKFTQTVWNQGDAVAKDVSVSVTLLSGEQVRLNGPSSLSPNEKAEYSASEATSLLVAKSKRNKIVLACENCLNR